MMTSDKTVFFGAPGCGKTHALMHVLSEELQKVEPDRIAYVSFTRKGAYEGRARAMDEFGYGAKDLPFFRTIHSLAFRAGAFTKYDMISRRHYKDFSDAMGMQFTGYYTEELTHNDDQYLFTHMLMVNNPRAAQQYMDTINVQKYRNVSTNYSRFKQVKRIVDFNDIIERFIAEDTPLPVDVAVIDEAQDLTTLQWRFCEVAFRNCKRVYIGGDDDQAIYEWNGADVHYFLGITGKRVILDKSWRMRENILNFSKRIAEQIGTRVEKNYAPCDGGGGIHYYNDVSEVPIDTESSWYMLARNNYYLRKYRDELKKRHIVYHDKHDFSVDAGAMDAIRIFENLRKERHYRTDADELKLKRYTKAELDLSLPWYDNMTMSVDDASYYRDLFKYKVPYDKDNTSVRVNTIHGVKGGEADNVLLTLDVTKNVVDNYQRNPDSELRCLYVACTRAKQNLHIVFSGSKNGYNDLMNIKELENA